MSEDLDRKRAFIISFLYLAIGAGLYFVFFKYVAGAIAPFVIAAVITLITSPVVDKLYRWTKIPRKGLALFICLLFYGVIVSGIVMLVTRLINVAIYFISILPSIYENNVQPAVESVLAWYESVFSDFGPDIDAYISEASSSILGWLAKLVSGLSQWAIGVGKAMAVGVPKLVVSVVFCVIASFFMATDYPRIRHFILAQFDERGQKIITGSRRYVFHNLAKMLVSYFFIMCITGVEIFSFLRIYQVRNALAIAIIIAVFDILPVLGTAGIVMPWAVIEFINGDIGMGLKLLLMYGFVTVVRNIIEPKLVGESIGLHPIIMLMSIYCGAKIFGAMGIIILPFTLIVVKNLNDEGLIHLFRSDYLLPNKKKAPRTVRKTVGTGPTPREPFSAAETAEDPAANAQNPERSPEQETPERSPELKTKES